MRRRRLFWQLYPATLLIALLSLAVLAADVEISLRRFYLDRTAADLEARARLAEYQIAPLLAAGKYAEIDALCKELGQRSSTRLTVILPDGKVVGDTLRPPQEMENHATRPEVVDAVDKGIGVSLRPSDTLKQELRYVAVAARQNGDPQAGALLGVVRAAVSLAAIDDALRGIRTHLAIAAILIAGALAAASLLIEGRIVKPLEELSRHAESLAQGDLGRRLPAANSKEVGGLSEALNKMAAELNDKLATVIRQKNERDAILSSMVEGVLAIDADERVLSMNAAAARLLETDAARAEGRSLPEIVRSIDLHKVVAAVLSTRQPVEGEVVLRDRGPRYLRVYGTVLGGKGDSPHLPERPEGCFAQMGTVPFSAPAERVGSRVDGRPGVLLVVHDVTEVKRLEGIRRDFVANVSHELKTPVTSIQGYVETLLDGAVDDPAERDKFLKIVAKHTERLHAILEDLLTLARVEQEGERHEVPLVRGPLRPVLDAALADCSAKAEEKRMRLTLECPPEISAAINASLLEQAVVNLLENAIVYSPPGEAIEVRCLEGDAEIEIRVRDHGCGIAREHLPRIFERFYRVDKARSRESGGTGLGLAIVKHIMQIHGGRAAVDSTPGQGSTFTLFLPK